MKISVMALLVIATCGLAIGQPVSKQPVRESGMSYPIDPMPMLYKHYQEAAAYNASHPAPMKNGTLSTAVSWGFKIGDTHTWWVADLETDKYYQDKSTCRGIGRHCYVFVEDSMWTSRVTQEAVDSIINDFDNTTPADPSKGIFITDSLAFGAPPDVDGDPKIIILICNVRDGFTGTGGYVQGFFDPKQEYSGSYSNMAEIYYLDANPTDLTHSYGISSAMSTAAHEFQHMINYNYHRTSVYPVFLNESCSKLAELLCGYPPSNLSLYANETNHYLFDWRTDDKTLVLNDYSRAQRFSLYLWDRFGVGLFKYMAQSKQTSELAIIGDALSRAGISTGFNDIFRNWLIANELDDTTSNRLYGYSYRGLPLSAGKLINNPNTSGTETVDHIASSYLIFKNGSNLTATFTNNGGNSNLEIQAVEVGASSKRVVAVPFGSQFSEPEFGSTYSTIAFIAINKDPSYSASFSYQSSGSVSSGVTELKYDMAEPVGYYDWTASDTVCVTFDAFPQGVLDSVRVALRKAGSISGGVYRYTGTSNPTPLGRLLAPVTAAISTTSPSPYPVPYENWSTIDLTKNAITTDQPFAVALVIPDNSGAPGVMISGQAMGGPYHSYTYLTADEASPQAAGWYLVSLSDTTMSAYLIRAYVSIATGVEEKAAVVPIQFALSQNYPNPFNPSTAIRYQVSTPSMVSLVLYDVLGRLVRTLVNKEVKKTGSFEVHFDGSDLPSGVYFCRMTADPLSGDAGFSRVMKMLLLK